MQDAPGETWEKHAVAALLAAMGVCMLAAALCRHLLPAWHPAALTAAAGCLTWLASLGMARAADLGIHTRVSVIEDMAGPAATARLNTIADLAFLAFSICSLAAGCAVLAADRGNALVLAAIPVGSALTALRLVRRLRRRREEGR